MPKPVNKQALSEQFMSTFNPHSQQLADFIEQHPRLFILTGAGISTGSGIPAYRDAKGNWQSPPPVQHGQFISQLAVRQRYWGRSLAGWHTMRDAQPSNAHKILAAFEKQGHIKLLVTQNVDRLHQKAGSQKVVDLHGRADIVACIECDHEITRDEMHQWCRRENPEFNTPLSSPRPDGDADFETDFSQFNVPNCPDCGGVMKARVVYFGDNVPKETVFSAIDALERSDALLCVGTSLQVFSGFRFNRHALQQKIPQAALTQGVTRADEMLDLKINAEINQTLEEVANLLGIDWR